MASQRKRNPNGGTITRRKDGRFQAAVYVLQPDGTRARKFAYGKTWADCDAKRRELLAKVDTGVPVPTRSAKLADWLPYWLDHIIKPRREPTTAAKYDVHVRLYLVPMLGAKRLESLTVGDVRRFLARLEKQTTAATARESHKVLRSALSAACREELITRNVVTLVEPPKVDARDLSPWSLDETLTLLSAARGDALYAPSSWRSPSVSGGVRSSVCAGRTSTWRRERSGSVSSGSGSVGSCTRTIRRGAAAVRRSLFPRCASLPCAVSG